jgi:hypothetical protein
MFPVILSKDINLNLQNVIFNPRSFG